MATLTFRTEIQKLLFTQELCGQISDGYWENARPDCHWVVWSNCEVRVGENVGRDFYAKKSNYAFNSEVLLDVVGERMVGMVKAFKGIPNLSLSLGGLLGEYSIQDLKRLAEKGDKYWVEKYEAILKVATEEEVEKAMSLESYSMKELRNDLREMSKIIKIKKA